MKINDVINNSNAIISLCFIHKQIYSCIHSPPPRPVLLEVIFIIIIISLLLLHYPIMLQINICYTFCCVTIISVLLLIPEPRHKTHSNCQKCSFDLSSRNSVVHLSVSPNFLCLLCVVTPTQYISTFYPWVDKTNFTQFLKEQYK